MKRFISALLTLSLALSLTACTSGNNTKPEQEGFVPSLDTETECAVNVVGHYSNFEALEAEFNRFNEIYPNVELTYTHIDDYNKIIHEVLTGKDAPEIFFSYPWMLTSEASVGIMDLAEDLSDEKYGFGLDCIKDGLLVRDTKGRLTMVPIYTTTFGMMVNEDIFEKENLSVPKTYSEFVDVCGKLKSLGYSDPVMGYGGNEALYSTMFQPFFSYTLSSDAGAMEALNSMEPEAGEYMRDALERTYDFMSLGFIDPESCSAMSDDYDKVILRFFEGDVPIMLASGNTVSGTEKRESKSEAFAASPFKYSFQPVPAGDDGGYFLNTISMGFSVNSGSDNVEMANEFMRFLISTEEINNMALLKRMVTPCKDMKMDEVYAPFGELKADSIIYAHLIRLTDEAEAAVKAAAQAVVRGEMTVDEAVSSYGTQAESGS